jgi:hypothetical protein
VRIYVDSVERLTAGVELDKLHHYELVEFTFSISTFYDRRVDFDAFLRLADDTGAAEQTRARMVDEAMRVIRNQTTNASFGSTEFVPVEDWELRTYASMNSEKL